MSRYINAVTWDLTWIDLLDDVRGLEGETAFISRCGVNSKKGKRICD